MSPRALACTHVGARGLLNVEDYLHHGIHAVCAAAHPHHPGPEEPHIDDRIHAATAALPPLPGSYLWALLVLLAGVFAFQTLGATLNEAIVVIQGAVAAIGLLVWRQGK